MTLRRRWLFVILVTVGGCRDASAPLDERRVVGDVVSSASEYGDIHVLRQSPTAPRLESYQVSFWAHQDQASTVTVNYEPTEGLSVGGPFLRFDVPREALRTGPDGLRLGARDSVFITLTIDPDNFSIEFAPSGLIFSRRHPATLAMWYGNADPDVNDDGVVDATDQTLADQLAIWGRHENEPRWRESSSHTEAGQQWISAALRHFSEYAVCW